MRAVRILLSARDPGGAAQLRALCPTLRADPRFEVEVAASGPAFDLLEAAGERPIRFALADGSDYVPAGEDPSALLDAAGALVDRMRPDALLVGISSLGVGLDEALLARAAGRPTFALQDYPGDANAIGRAWAGTYFVRDEAAARLTRERFGVATVPVGSLRHAAYAALDVSGLRGRTRERIGAAPPRPVLGFFAQPPEIPGHEAAFRHLAEALARRAHKPLVLLREHPKFREAFAGHAAALRRAGVTVRDAAEGDVEPWLCACDVVATTFSHVGMDYAFLTARSQESLGCTVFLLTTSEIRRFLRDYSGMALPDGVEAGLGLVAESAAAVSPVLDRALDPVTCRQYHRASLGLPGEARPDVIKLALAEAGARWIAGAQRRR